MEMLQIKRSNVEYYKGHAEEDNIFYMITNVYQEQEFAKNNSSIKKIDRSEIPYTAFVNISLQGRQKTVMIMRDFLNGKLR